MGWLENNKQCYRKGNGFLSHIYIKVTLLSSKNETALSNTTAVISVIFLMICLTCRPKYLEIALGEILLRNIHRLGLE